MDSTRCSCGQEYRTVHVGSLSVRRVCPCGRWGVEEFANRTVRFQIDQPKPENEQPRTEEAAQ